MDFFQQEENIFIYICTNRNVEKIEKTKKTSQQISYVEKPSDLLAPNCKLMTFNMNCEPHSLNVKCHVLLRLPGSYKTFFFEYFMNDPKCPMLDEKPSQH